MDQLLKATLCLGNLILLAGILGAFLNSPNQPPDRAFDLSFWLQPALPIHPSPTATPIALTPSSATCATTLLNPHSGD
ncbi:MAG: hypothetical protein AAGG51_23390 [Cyanobacteria bacterium P01_G01_bin.54]